MKILISKELGAMYTLNNGVLLFSPVKDDIVINTEQFDEVDKELIGDEQITYRGKPMTFNDAYKIIEDKLNK